MTAQGVSVSDDRGSARHRSDQWLKDWRKGLRRVVSWLLRRPAPEKAGSHRKGGQS
jgi:hypothetical protein